MDEKDIVLQLNSLPVGQCLAVPPLLGRARADSWIPNTLSFQVVLSGEIPTTPWNTDQETILRRGDLICCARGAATTRRYNVARKHLAFSLNAGQLDITLFERAADDAPGFAHQQHWHGIAPVACTQLGQLIDTVLKQTSLDNCIEYLARCFLPLLKRELGVQQSSQFNKAMQWLRKHACEELDRSDLAAQLHCHPDHVSRLFKNAAGGNGASFADTRKRLRCERVRALLANHELSLAEIATQCGFNSETYMIRSFKQMYGHPPGAWRRASGYDH